MTRTDPAFFVKKTPVRALGKWHTICDEDLVLNRFQEIVRVGTAAKGYSGFTLINELVLAATVGNDNLALVGEVLGNADDFDLCFVDIAHPHRAHR